MSQVAFPRVAARLRKSARTTSAPGDRDNAEAILKEAAFVLHLVRTVKDGMHEPRQRAKRGRAFIVLAAIAAICLAGLVIAGTATAQAPQVPALPSAAPAAPLFAPGRATGPTADSRRRGQGHRRGRLRERLRGTLGHGGR
jgi:hypothetical protein